MKNFGTKIHQIITNYWYIFAFTSILFLSNIILIIEKFFRNGLTFDGSFFAIIFLSIALECLFCFILYYSKKNNWKIEKLFLILGLSIGTLYVFAIPLSCAPDEVSHFLRVYEISDGHFVSDTTEDGLLAGSVQPLNVQYVVYDLYQGEVTYEQILTKLNLYYEGDEAFVANSAPGYSVISYLPHVAGILIGRGLHLPIVVSAYLAKMFHLVTCILILFFAIKYIPFLKSTLFFIAFLPITMQGMASLSADGFLISCSIALISFVLYATYTQNFRIHFKHLLLILFLCLVVSLGKSIYAPLCLLLFTIPKERFGNMTRKLFTIFTIGGITLATVLLWLYLTPPLSSVTDSSAQIASITNNPFSFIFIILKTIIIKSPNYATELLGRRLEWFNLVLSPYYIIISGGFFLSLCYKEKFKIRKSFKLLSIFAICFAALASFTVMYIQWTPVGTDIIQGVQGRYFLPLFILFPTIFFKTYKDKDKIPKVPAKIYQSNYLYLFIIFESVYTLSAIACFHI